MTGCPDRRAGGLRLRRPWLVPDRTAPTAGRCSLAPGSAKPGGRRRRVPSAHA
jgi:hypothetical protein